MVRGEMENPRSYEDEVVLHRVLLSACGVEMDYKAEIELKNNSPQIPVGHYVGYSYYQCTLLTASLVP